MAGRPATPRYPEGDFPSIQAVELGEVYFVVDGHHRTAAASWYEEIYPPGMAALNRAELPQTYEYKTDADLFLPSAKPNAILGSRARLLH